MELTCQQVFHNINENIFITKEKRFVPGETKRKVSGIWKYVLEIFELKDGREQLIKQFVQCSICKLVMKYDSKKLGTNHISNHINKHPQSQPKPVGGTILGFLSTKETERVVSTADKEKVLKSAVKFVAKDLRPFESVQGDGFIQLAHTLWNMGAKNGFISTETMKKVLPSPQTVSRHVEITAANWKLLMINMLQTVIAVSIGVGVTIDLWSDDFKQNTYLAITFHFIYKNKLHDQVFGVVPFDPEEDQRHSTVKSYLDAKLNLLEVPNIWEKIVFTTDRGGNVKKALENVTRMNCFPHFLNNISKEACTVPSAFETLEKCKKLVKYFKKCGKNNCLATSLKSASSTRFNSNYATVESILKNWDDVTKILNESGEMERLNGIVYFTCLLNLKYFGVLQFIVFFIFFRYRLRLLGKDSIFFKSVFKLDQKN